MMRLGNMLKIFFVWGSVSVIMLLNVIRIKTCTAFKFVSKSNDFALSTY